MLLSDLIRDGASQTDPISGALIQTFPDDSTGACALGAAAYTLRQKGLIQHKSEVRKFSFTQELVPPIRQPEVMVSHAVSAWARPLEKIIMILNDLHGWSREAIAEWLDAEFSEEELTVPREELSGVRSGGGAKREEARAREQVAV